MKKRAVPLSANKEPFSVKSSLLTSLPHIDHIFIGRGADLNSPEIPFYPVPVRSLNQIHGNGICLLDEADAKSGQLVMGDCDAVITAVKQIPIGIRTADCLPLLLADVNGRVAAAVHAGWRSFAAGIIAKTADTIERCYGIPPSFLAAAVGPSICGRCFEIGEEVAHRFRSAFGDERVLPFADYNKRRGKCFLDLSGLAEALLLQLGLRSDRIERSLHCTVCEKGRLFSHRGAGDTGRNWAVIGLKQG